MKSHIDPNVFIDDDGQVYIYQGGGAVCMGGKLKDNMMEVDGEMQEMTGLVDFHEAAWLHKRNGVYYLSYSDNHDDKRNDGVKGDNRMRYATSDNPLGPWKHQGIYMEPTDSYTNHGSIVEYKGQWYAFYHNSTLSNHDWLRSICVDKLYYNEDGTIQMVKQTNKMNMYFIGYDIGSSSVKSCLVSASTGEIVASDFFPKEEMKITANKLGWAEQDPEMWWANLKLATNR